MRFVFFSLLFAFCFFVRVVLFYLRFLFFICVFPFLFAFSFLYLRFLFCLCLSLLGHRNTRVPRAKNRWAVTRSKRQK